MAMATSVEVTVPGDVEHLASLRDCVETFCDQLGQLPNFTMAVVLSVDEAATNVVMHGYGQCVGDVQLQVSVVDGSLVVRLTDTAPPYDPTQAPTPDISAPIEDRAIGGLGIHLIRNNMDVVAHRITEAGGNELTLTKRLAAPQGA